MSLWVGSHLDKVKSHYIYLIEESNTQGRGHSPSCKSVKDEMKVMPIETSDTLKYKEHNLEIKTKDQRCLLVWNEAPLLTSVPLKQTKETSKDNHKDLEQHTTG